MASVQFVVDRHIWAAYNIPFDPCPHRPVVLDTNNLPRTLIDLGFVDYFGVIGSNCFECGDGGMRSNTRMQLLNPFFEKG